MGGNPDIGSLALTDNKRLQGFAGQRPSMLVVGELPNRSVRVQVEWNFQNMNKSVALGVILSLLLTVNSQAADSSPVDPNKVQKAEVVLRVKLLSSGEGSKYLWDKVEVLQVVKNKSGYAFGKNLSVAHYSWKPGIAEGTCTIYLERYSPKRNSLWKLLNGSGEDGVSHVMP